MAWLWSDPNPSNATQGAVSSGAHLTSENIGHLVAAILHNRIQQEQMQNQQTQQIAGAIGGIGNRMQQQNDQGSLAAFQQSGLTDQSDAVINPDQQAMLGKMSPGAKEQAMNWVQQTQAQGQNQDNSQQLLDAKISDMNAQASQRYAGQPGVDPVLNARRLQLIQEGNLKSSLNAAKSYQGLLSRNMPSSQPSATSSVEPPLPTGGANAAPSGPSQAPPVGTRRSFGNGNIGEWDGSSWIQVQ